MSERTLRAELGHLTEVERPEGLEIASITRYDLPELAILHVLAYGLPYTAEGLLESSDEMRMLFDGAFGKPHDHSFIGAWLDGVLVGAILCVMESPWDDGVDGPFVIDLMVDPEHRRKGIATALVSELAHRADAWGWEQLSLRIDSRHDSAAKLYEVLGFNDIQ
ncbi:MAG: GNAT family N-acetyltransferase [Actinobacteria bacterium]|nr:MAG: GNAT family N-acetyltransferase [Actinomycetota bacterium]